MSSTALPPESTTIRLPLSTEGRRAQRRYVEIAVHGLLLACAIISVATTIGIVTVLCKESWPFFREVPLKEFFLGTKWAPLFSPRHFGILPLVCGTMLVAGGSAMLAVPLGIGTAIFLSEFASGALRNVIKPFLEILAGIPSVVFGYLAVVFVSPWVRWVFPSAELFNAANACVVVGIMILPTIVTLSEEVLRAVPRSLREGAYALGANKFDVSTRIVVPAAMSGIMASILLAIARAIGETMAVTLAAGASPKLTLNPLVSVQTMTAYIVEVTQGDIPAGTLEHRTVFAVGLTLFSLTLLLNLMAQWILGKLREQYE